MAKEVDIQRVWDLVDVVEHVRHVSERHQGHCLLHGRLGEVVPELPEEIQLENLLGRGSPGQRELAGLAAPLVSEELVSEAVGGTSVYVWLRRLLILAVLHTCHGAEGRLGGSFGGPPGCFLLIVF